MGAQTLSTQQAFSEWHILESFSDLVTPFYERTTTRDGQFILYEAECPEQVQLLLWAQDHLPRPETMSPNSVLSPQQVLKFGEPWALSKTQFFEHRFLLLLKAQTCSSGRRGPQDLLQKKDTPLIPRASNKSQLAEASQIPLLIQGEVWEPSRSL